MKLHVTKQEMLDLLTRALSVKVTGFTIAKETKADVIESAMSVQFGTDRFPLNKKIEAIKLLRTVVLENCMWSMGLSEAKYAVENWVKWIAFVSKHKRVPVFNYDRPDPFS